jgi:metallo-beta-lactamase family protein
LKITFLGADHEVTGSLTLIEVGDKKGIVDCGMEQGKDIFENQQLPVAPGTLDFVLLTHAHIDHSGNLPLLYKNGFRGNVYATAATCSLCDIMLRDCANIQMQEAEWKSRKAMRSGGAQVEPLYDMEDVAGIVSRLVPCDYGKEILVNDCVTIRFTDVGHLLGSACIETWLTEGGETRKMTFSGDIGNVNQPILKDPNHIADTEYLMIESTYGDRDHDAQRIDYVSDLAGIIQKTLDRGGNVVIPAFAVGRTQELLYFIREIKERKLVTGHGDFPVYIDSPLAIEATSIFLQCDMEFVDEDMQKLIRSGVNPIVFPGLKVAVSQEESKAINEDNEPKVIISASGMCDAGRVRHHLKHNLWHKESTILFVGYQAVGTLGRILNDGAKKVKLFNEDIDVAAEITALPGVSGHADKTGLINWLQAIPEKPKMVFVNHGDPDACESFKNCIEQEYGYKAFAPYSGTSFDLITGQFDVITEGKPVEKKGPVQTGPEGEKHYVNPVFDALVSAGERLLKAIHALAGSPNKELRSFTDEVSRLAEKMEKYKKD